MKIKIRNVFAQDESAIVIKNLQDDKNIVLDKNVGEPNLKISCKTNNGFSCFINMPKTACLTIECLRDSEE